ncbi:MAG: chemotaxis protein CheW [Candidatus Polarisedimenticolaceae bacterium]|nr:chemotaxis protein CheW [Candidatus Polarisedimenticolaceae bacterium]
MNQLPLEVRAVLLPLYYGQLLLPNASVAEIAAFREPTELPDTPDWLLGMISWRWKEIPLVCFDTLVGMAPEKRGIRARIAICYALGGNANRPFLGVLTQSVPHLTRVSEDTVESDPSPSELGDVVIEQVLVNGEKTWVPDLELIESMVDSALVE